MKMRKLSYFLNGILGGIYWAAGFSTQIKYAWLALNIAAFTFVNIFGCIGYLAATPNLSLNDYVFTFFDMDAISYTTAIVPLFTYYFRNEMNTFLSEIETEFYPNGLGKEITGTSSEKNVIGVIIFQTIVCFLYNFLGFFSLILFQEENSFHNIDHYIYPVPFLDKIKSPYMYSCLFILHIFCLVPIAAVIIAFTSFFALIGYQFHKAFSNLSSRLECVSKKLNRAVESINEGKQDLFGCAPFSEAEGITFSQHEQEVKSSQQDFVDDLLKAMQYYQNITRVIKLIKPYIEFVFSLVLIGYLCGQFFVLYILFAPCVTVIRRTKGIISFIMINTIMYCCCYTGELFNDMSIMLQKNVYSLPWSYLTPKQRKDVYIFLFQAQQPIKFHGFYVFPLRMASFPSSLRMIYSLVNVLLAR